MEEIGIIFVISVLLLTYVKTDIFGSGKCMGLKIIWTRHANECILYDTVSIDWLVMRNDIVFRIMYFRTDNKTIVYEYQKRYMVFESMYD